MIVDLSEASLIIIKEFINHGQKNPEYMSLAFNCNEAAFRIRLARLDNDIKSAEKREKDGDHCPQCGEWIGLHNDHCPECGWIKDKESEINGN